ncbi:MAG TPA: phytanoyl-CoA dioxygenase family protein [Thermoanaerobaculia bacterium]|nr:phytanoyl-CoA dioxygenase family protein [Thermoanaerobaculia bacterium]
MGLTPEEVRSFRERGHLAPVPVLSPSEAAAARAELETLLGATGGMAAPAARHKPHLYAKWVSDLVRHPRVLDPVESLIGREVLVWRSVFFVKAGRTPGFVAWHQDSSYWGLAPEDGVVTAWIALTESTVENGCLRVVDGSHRGPDVPHAIRFGGDNLLVRGQSAAVDIPEDRVRHVELAPGEMSLHHVRLLHGSGPNASANLRVGLAVRYIATGVSRRGRRQSATLVRGEDRFGHFDLEAAPRFDGDPAALAWHRRSRRRYAAELLRESLRKPTRANLRSAARLAAHPARLFRAVRSLWHSEPAGASPGGKKGD